MDGKNEATSALVDLFTQVEVAYSVITLEIVGYR